MDREKVIKGFELFIKEFELFIKEIHPVCIGEGVELDMFRNVLALLKEQETTSTGKTRIFQCEKCGYGIDDIYLSNEHDFDVYPHFCPHCGRAVKWE